MIPPATAWLVRPGIDRWRRGTLTMEEALVTFAAEDGERISISPADLERVRRLRGTPVLEVRCQRDGQSILVLFYFVEPPPMGERSALSRPGGRKAHRIAAIRTLHTANRRVKPMVDAWAQAVREMMES